MLINSLIALPHALPSRDSSISYNKLTYNTVTNDFVDADSNPIIPYIAGGGYLQIAAKWITSVDDGKELSANLVAYDDNKDNKILIKNLTIKIGEIVTFDTNGNIFTVPVFYPYWSIEYIGMINAIPTSDTHILFLTSIKKGC